MCHGPRVSQAACVTGCMCHGLRVSRAARVTGCTSPNVLCRPTPHQHRKPHTLPSPTRKRCSSSGVSRRPLGRSGRQPWGPVPGAVAAWPLCSQGSPASPVTSPRPSPRRRRSARRKASCSFLTGTGFSQTFVRGVVAGRGVEPGDVTSVRWGATWCRVKPEPAGPQPLPGRCGAWTSVLVGPRAAWTVEGHCSKGHGLQAFFCLIPFIIHAPVFIVTLGASAQIPETAHAQA